MGVLGVEVCGAEFMVRAAPPFSRFRDKGSGFGWFFGGGGGGGRGEW